MELKATRYVVDEGVATVMLSRPARRNAWTGRMHAEYRWCLATANADPSVRVVVVTGDPAGRAFCVGADAEALSGHATRGGYDDGLAAGATERDGRAEATGRPGPPPLPDVPGFLWQWELRVPIVAAINGGCAGIALALVCCCDLRVGLAGARLTTAAPALGLPAEYGLSWLLPRLIGATHAADLLLTGRTIDAAEATRLGVLNAVHDPGHFPAAVRELAHRFTAGVSPTAVAATKRQLYDDLRRHDAAASVRDSLVRIDELMAGPDFAEGVRALREKRPPRF